MDTHRRELLRGSSLALLLRVAGVGAAYLFNFVIARKFGASVVGAFAVTTTIIMILGMLSRFGFDRAIVRFVASSLSAGSRSEAAAYYWYSLMIVGGLGAVCSVLMFFGAEFLAGQVFDKPHLATALRTGAPAVLLFSVTLLSAEALRGSKRIGAFAFLRHLLIYLIATPVLIVLIVLNGNLDPLTAPVVAFVSATGIAAVIALVWTSRILPWVSPATFVSAAAMLGVATPMLLSNSMGMIISWTDILMLGRFVSDAEVGVYSITFKLAFVTGIILNAVNSISTPKFAELSAAGDNESLAAVMRQTTRLLFITAMPILLLLIVAGKLLLGLFGDEFETGYTALMILAAGQFVSTISGPVGNLLQMTGNEKIFLAVVAVMAAVNVILNLVLIPRFGIVGAATASAITLTANNLVCVFVVYRRLGFVSIYWPFYAKR